MCLFYTYTGYCQCNARRNFSAPDYFGSERTISSMSRRATLQARLRGADRDDSRCARRQNRKPKRLARATRRYIRSWLPFRQLQRVHGYESPPLTRRDDRVCQRETPETHRNSTLAKDRVAPRSRFPRRQLRHRAYDRSQESLP